MAETIISCFKCHGTGAYDVPVLDENGEWIDKWESCHCEVCRGTGKIDIESYEWFQKQMRGDKDGKTDTEKI